MRLHDNDKLLSRADVENIFGVSKRFLEVAVQRGDGPRMIEIGRLVRYRIGDVRAWIEGCAVDKCNSAGAVK